MTAEPMAQPADGSVSAIGTRAGPVARAPAKVWLWTAVALTLSAVGGCQQALTGADPNADDEVLIYGAIVRSLMERADLRNASAGRIWIPAHYVANERHDPAPIPSTLREGLVRDVSEVRWVGDWQNIFTDLFACPEGISVRLPGQGCPIVEDGVIALLGELETRGDGSVEVVAELIESVWSREGGASTWSNGYRIRVGRVSSSAGWSVTDVSHIWES